MNTITQQYESNIRRSEQEEFSQYLNPYLIANHKNASTLEREVISKVFYVYLTLGILDGKALVKENKFTALVSRRCRAHLRSELVKRTFIASVKPTLEASINVPKLAYRVVKEVEELIFHESRLRDSSVIGRWPDGELGYLSN